MKLLFSIALIYVLAAISPLSVAAQAKREGDASAAEIKAIVLKRGASDKKRIVVRMRNGEKLNGFISQINEDSFVLTDAESRQPTTIAYADVRSVGGRLSKGGKIALGVAAGAAAVVGIIVISFFVRRCRNEGGCGG